MSEDITELSRRISAAFDRVDQGLEALARKSVPAPIPAPIPAPVQAAEGEGSAALLRALEAARTSIEDWADRYRALQAQMGAETLALALEITRLTDELAAARASVAPPFNTDAAPDSADVDELTARIAEQEAELETLRAERVFDATELAAIIAALDPLVQEAPHV
jgi:hypothetical protein